MWNFVKGFGKVHDNEISLNNFILHQHTRKVKNTMQQTTDQSFSLASAVKLWNMSLQNTYLIIWKATVYYMIFNMASDILDPVKLNYCPIILQLIQVREIGLLFAALYFSPFLYAGATFACFQSVGMQPV
jgi:hypothetical protein